MMESEKWMVEIEKNPAILLDCCEVHYDGMNIKFSFNMYPAWGLAWLKQENAKRMTELSKKYSTDGKLEETISVA